MSFESFAENRLVIDAVIRKS
ncbi:MAG: hypothetical protein ACTSUQ_01680 [Candidatus Freyarchaeota archaeon]